MKFLKLISITIRILQNKYENTDGSAMLHVIKECPRSYYMSFIVKKGSPLLPTFSNFIRSLFEGGIFLFSNMTYDISIEMNKLNFFIE